jgi:hypothetical protein
MSDIVERLRYYQRTNGFDDEASKLVDEAVAEIERLQQEAIDFKEFIKWDERERG